MSDLMNPSEYRLVGKIAIGVVCVLTLGIGGCLIGEPHYHVWEQKMRGEAELAKAEFSKKVIIETAKAKAASATLDAEAEVIRAEGVAKANKIIGDSLRGNESYLRYLWIMGIDHESAKTIVYVPTEANLPILESSRHLMEGK